MNREIPEIILSYKDYLTVIQEKSPSTVYSYISDINIFIDYLKSYDKYKKRKFNEEFIKLIDLRDLYGFLSYLKNERDNSAYARARKIAALKSFFKYCETKLKIITYNPCTELETPKKTKKQINYLSLEESKELLNNVDSRNKPRDLAILTLFLNCGLRLNELCNIKMQDIREDTLVVRGKGDKDRTIYLNEMCLKAIGKYMKERIHIKNNYLFLSERKRQISKRQVQYIVKKNILNANLDTSKYTVHKLRHTAATLLYKYSNVDIRTIQEILGHKNISTTTIYTHVDNEQVRDAIKSNPLNVI